MHIFTEDSFKSVIILHNYLDHFSYKCSFVPLYALLLKGSDTFMLTIYEIEVCQIQIT